MAGDGSELFLTGSLLEEPAGFRRLYFELEGAVGEGGKLDLERYVSADVRGYLIELFAELHHVDSEWTKGLAHLGVGLGYAGVDAQIDCGCLSAELPL